MVSQTPSRSSSRGRTDGFGGVQRAYDPQATARAGVVLPPSPQVRLVEGQQAAPQRTWDVELPRSGRWRVRGVAGSGVSSLLIDTVIGVLHSGADPDGVLVIASAKESGSALRRELAAHLDDYAASNSMVRSVHSLAFALLRSADSAVNEANSSESLRLITGAEQDAVIQELLAGHAEAGGALWPDYIRPALGFVGFARQLRDFILRAVERGLGPNDLIDLGQRHDRPMWVSAGTFLREYEEVMALSGINSYSAAELVTQVLLRPELTEHHPWHTIIVDDAQLLAPAAGTLISRLSRTADLTVVAGDPEQAVFGFRGANSDFLETFDADHELTLVESRRAAPPACISIVGTQAEQRDVLADSVRRRHLDDGIDWRDIAVIVRSTSDIGVVRRALLAAGVPVHINPTDVVLAEQRLVSAILLALRALYEPVTDAELEELITGPVGGADPVSLRRLIRGLRRFDPATRGMETLRGLLDGDLPDFKDLLAPREVAILDRIRSVIRAGRDVIAQHGSVEEVMWAVWSATGLAERLQAAALRGGATGSQADRDLDAMMAFFDAAGDFAERRPGTGIQAFITFIMDQELPTGVRDRRTAMPQAVSVLTAHGIVGYEFDTVVVVGAQEGTWPTLSETGSLLGQEDLIDLLDDGIDPDVPVSHVAQRLEEERRLFHVATTRHRSRLHIIAINAPDGDEVLEPSRFIDDFAQVRVNIPEKLARLRAASRFASQALGRELGLNFPDPVADNVDIPGDGSTLEDPASIDAVVSAPTRPTRDLDTELDPLNVSVLSVPALVAQLRRVVCANDDDAAPELKEQAARQLARLAEAGVPGAEPSGWWAARSTAGNRELPTKGTLSPSKLEALLACPLRAMVGNLSEEETTPIALTRGSMAHAFLEALGKGADPDTAQAMTLEAFASIQNSPQWQRETELAAFERLLERTRAWTEHSRSALELVDVEVPVKVELMPGLALTGYIDRLERTPDNGDYVVVDLKTGATAPSAADAQANIQLAAYQLALSRARIVHDPATGRVSVVTAPAPTTDDAQTGLSRGGGILVYPATSNVSITTKEQAPWDDESLDELAQALPPLAAQLHGPTLEARLNSGCDSCSIRHICPLQPEGRMTTDAL